MDEKKVEDAIEKLLSQPKVVEVDGQRVENQSVGDLIEADRYLASKKAAARGRSPLRFAHMASGGAVV